MIFRVRLRGTGRVEIAAYGVGDAEHATEKEIRRVWPDARVEVTEIARTGEGRKIVEEFAVGFALRVDLRVEGSTPEEARREAFRVARMCVAGTRFERTAWESGEVSGESG